MNNRPPCHIGQLFGLLLSRILVAAAIDPTRGSIKPALG